MMLPQVVFKRYETTLALPIEYGTVSVGLVLSGLIFFQEYRCMDPWQIGLTLSGTAIVICGIQLIHRPSLPCTWPSSLSRPKMQPHQIST